MVSRLGAMGFHNTGELRTIGRFGLLGQKREAVWYKLLKEHCLSQSYHKLKNKQKPYLITAAILPVSTGNPLSPSWSAGRTDDHLLNL